ncbi:MAG: XdhC family protein [Paracoccus sp. (in: a-proteobacteria)]|nr:XdhC family protein [Paracoccus sp. (in: a-proteobacteria)]
MLDPTDPIRALAAQPGGVLAVLIATEGPAPHAPGAVMACLPDGGRVGTLSAGCIEADIQIHAEAVRASGKPVTLRYGRGSPFGDLRLPCGGMIEVLLTPAPCPETIAKTLDRLAQREAVTLALAGPDGGTHPLRLRPEIKLYIAGTGPEPVALARLAQAAGLPHLLLSPDAATRAGHDGPSQPLGALWPEDFAPDPFSAVVLFFHDHDREPPLMAAALRSRAFYVGAQGSRAARAVRDAGLRDLGLDDALIARARGPIGAITQAREPRLLAASALTEILELAQNL